MYSWANTTIKDEHDNQDTQDLFFLACLWITWTVMSVCLLTDSYMVLTYDVKILRDISSIDQQIGQISDLVSN